MMLRYDVLGRLPVSVTATETMRLVNVGQHGALVEGSVPLVKETVHTMRLVHEDAVSDITVRVRRVTEVSAAPEPVRYLIGLEFLQPSPDAEQMIARMVSVSGGGKADVVRV